MDPNLPLYFVGTPKTQLEGFVAQNRIIATMFSIFGVVAMVLASVGMYGVMSFSVNQRRQEFGVRMALGAHYGRILQMVLRQGIVQLAIGLALGLGVALAPGAAGGRGDPEHPLRRQCHRSRDLCDGVRTHHDRLAGSDARTGAAGHSGGSDDCPPNRVAGPTACNSL